MLSDDDDVATVWVCQGPPACEKEGDEAVKAQQDGCIWCQRHILIGDTWQVEQPATA